MPPVTNRTAIEQDWKCGRSRWWGQHEGGVGLMPLEEASALRVGKEIHEDFANLIMGKPCDIQPFPENDQAAQEEWARRIGWAYAWGRFAWEKWFADSYDVVGVEHELVLSRPDLWVAFTADATLRNRETRKLVVIDFKSVGNLGYGWMDSWPFSIQMHMNILGVEEEYGEDVSHAQVIGLVKGQYRDGKLRHPYVWGYFKNGTWSSEYKWGWELRPTWEYGSGGKTGVMEWVEFCGENMALAQFPMSAPVVVDRRLVERLITLRAKREADVHYILKTIPLTFAEMSDEDLDVLDQHFEPRYSVCKPTFGNECPFLKCCHNADIGADPIGSGYFVQRIPHHDVVDEDE